MTRFVTGVFLAALVAGSAAAQVGDGRVYVRRIEFVGAENVSDDLLRRRMLQLEGTYVNTTSLERSVRRIEALPYIESADVRLRAVANAPDQTDVIVTIVDLPPRRWGGGGAWSESLGASVNGFFVNENLFGSGNRFAGRLDVSDIRTALDVSYTNPFVGRSEISRTVSLNLRDSDRLTLDTSDLQAEIGALNLVYRYPTGERQAVQFGVGLQTVDLETGNTVSDQLFDWIGRNGDGTVSGETAATDYVTADLLFGWRYDSRDAPVFAESGALHQFQVRTTLPGSEIEYATIDYRFDRYWPLGNGWIANLGAHIGYGTQLGSDTTSLPPNLNWFAGGFRSVRGYRENSLGPKDSLANAYGGNLVTTAQLELIAPLPEKWRAKTRLSVFYDVGNVFSTEGIDFVDSQGVPLDYGFDVSELRHSAGVAARFKLPFGVLGVSYGVHIAADDDNSNAFFRDDLERLQITLGVDF